MRRRTRPGLLVLSLILLAPAGCVGAPRAETITVGSDESHSDEDIVLSGGSLEIPEGVRYEIEGGSLRLTPNPDVVVDGVIEVRGTFILRNATLGNLFRFTAHPSATVRLEGATVPAGPVPPVFVVLSPDTRIVDSTLDVAYLEIRASAELRNNVIRSQTLQPAVLWRTSTVAMVENEVAAVGYGVIFDHAEGEASGNTVSAGTDGLTTGIAVRGGSLKLRDNHVTRSAVGIGIENALGEVAGNRIENATQIGIGIVCTSATKLSVKQNRISGAVVAGIGLKDCPAGAVVEGNSVEGVVNRSATGSTQYGAGIGVDGGSPILTRNTLAQNDVAIGIKTGAPSAHLNNFERNLRFGMLVAVQGATPLDASNNWWGAQSGPVVSAPGQAEPPATPPGAERVGPGINYTPWSTQRN